ncbi:metal-dependent hydrolase [Halalkalicoccus jeotgali]|uniref:Membrane-bound metal-dependent hydrolase n=1 Tax=Halalkalicoccus jeotgali (strain DSM 18796 / CECT 7217 / JCM 14584 / KCTC 4019 / B3) TaxID=795797 RepID=D8J6L0_HALJB|nr:metal-dependent hydrolase [Halalkalicoccus jeotgali]ADJ13887.1 membrane-bound metal-dependent hydrolase [Halalkalicoccus jeotgali B3]ELY34066.1 membrane-bound metal-dependent hydrolase [Halalkalicoccus jeotgali B3]
MVDVLGHLGMALIWLAPVWFFTDTPKTALAIVSTGFWFGMLPDVDLVISNQIVGIHHHGVFHTVLAVAIFAAIIGPLWGLVVKKLLGGTTWFSPDAQKRATAIGVIVVFVTGLAHLFADILSAPDVSTRIEPLWPIHKGPIAFIDVLWYQSVWATWALFLTGLVINGVLWYRYNN